MAYCQHAHRTTIELSDVELLMKRSESEFLSSLLNYSTWFRNCDYSV